MSFKRIVLHDLNDVALIVCIDSSVIYENQVGGSACFSAEVEGVLASLYIPLEKSRLLVSLPFDGEPFGLSEKAADTIDKILSSEVATNFLRIDRTKILQSMEAWVFVRIESPVGDFVASESVNRAFGGPPTHLFGFGECGGVLTWPNSD